MTTSSLSFSWLLIGSGRNAANVFDIARYAPDQHGQPSSPSLVGVAPKTG